ncbi:MAG: rod shape-determining protein RodA [Candidatus Atribacteria bacterium]|nr:rod shape-determining protein RodA [Candidatus Atribacteria bacterium]
MLSWWNMAVTEVEKQHIGDETWSSGIWRIGVFPKMKLVKLFLLILLSLCSVGIMAVYSSDPLRSSGFLGGSFFGRQVIWCLLSWLVFFLVSRIDYHWFLKLEWIIYFFIIVSLAGVLVFGNGDETGAKRWILSRSVQPSEFSKVAFAIFLSALFSRSIDAYGSWKLMIQSFFFTILPVFLIFVEPDLGTSLVILILWFAALYCSGFHWKKFLAVFAFFGVFFPLSWPFLKDYQKNRLLSFLSPQSDPLGTGYNVLQSQIAIGGGGILGKGWLLGTQSQLRFLPARYTDFIFAAWCEQLGFVGGILMVTLFLFLIWVILRIGREAPDLEGKILASLFGIMFIFQTTINIGMNMGVMPVTGIPLPFVSYGGSSLLINMVAMGIVWNIAKAGGSEQ